MDDRDVGGRTLTALKWGYGGAAARAAIQLFIQMLLARLLGPEIFGQAMATMLVLGIGWILSEAGFGTALIQKASVDQRDISSALGWVLVFSTGMAMLVMLMSTSLAAWLGDATLQPLILFAGAVIPLQALCNIPMSLMRRNLDARRTQVIYISSYIIAYGVVGLTLAWSGAGAWSLVIAAALQALISLLASYAVIRHTLRPSLHGAGMLWRFGAQVTLINVTGWLAEHADRFFVNRFWGAAALGEYTAAATLSRAPAGLMMSSAQSVTLASASRVQDDRNRLARSYLALLCVVTLITAPCFTLLAWNADAVVHLVYGGRWSNTGPLFAAFCASIPFFSILSVSGPVLWAINAVRQDLYIQLFMLAAVALGFYGLRHYDLVVVAWLIPLLYAIRCMSAYFALQQRLCFHHRSASRAILAGVAISCLISFACYAVSKILEPIPALLAVTPLSAVISLVCLRLWPRLLLAPELISLLINRSESSPALNKLCQLVDLKK
jgi:lipopolysaccharide exporter